MADVKIPNEEPGLVQKTKLPYAEVLELACAQAADLIHIPDINHYDGRPFSLFTRDDTLKAFAESGRTHIFLELMPKFQEHADALTGGTINTDQFVERLRKNNFQDIRLDKDEELKELADFIVKSHKLGMKVHFCNPANGTPENIVVEMSRRLQGKPAAEIQVHMDILARGLFQVESPLREQVTACLFRKTPAEVKDFWTKLENSPDEKLLETSKAEFEKVILALTTPEALKERLKAANLVRLSDDELAGIIDRKLGGEQGVLFYGAQHGTNSHDLNEQLADKGVSSARLDVYPDRKSFELVMRSLKNENTITGQNYGVDKPDLVYIVSEGVLYTTTETSPALVKSIEAKAKLEPVTASDKDSGVDENLGRQLLNEVTAPKTAPAAPVP